MAQFRLPEGPSLLLSTEAGGEGRNFQFCRRLVLFDLPSSAGWTLGTIVGAVLLLQGVSLTLLGLEVRHSPSRTTAHA